MTTRLRQDISLYMTLVRSRVRSQAQYRGSFLLLTFVTFLGMATELVALIFLLDTFGDIAGWDIGEIALLYGLAGVAFGISEMIGAGFDMFRDMIRQGELDQLLLRPAGVFTQVMAADFQLRRFSRIGQALVALVLALRWTSIDWTPEKMLYLPLVIASGAVMFLAVFVLGATLCFWTVESVEVINTLTNGGSEMTSYPMSIYHDLMQRFFTFVIPLLFVSYIPALYLLDRPEASDWPRWIPLMPPVAAAGLAGVAYVLWGIGVRHYRSAGS
ncbi:MAG: ABC-2 family transporter protein [Thermomicrobiales bacterium]|nr:ABC-2 family transporter protein [Thermomicrobiales bacterium]